MSDLVKRLRDGCNLQQRDGERAADRIEKLERELTESRESLRLAVKSADLADAAIDTVRKELAAEKALADRLCMELEHSGVLVSLGMVDYRKARGLK